MSKGLIDTWVIENIKESDNPIQKKRIEDLKQLIREFNRKKLNDWENEKIWSAPDLVFEINEGLLGDEVSND